jgi:Transposase
VFIIGIDPHKASHTVAVLNGREQVVGEIRVHADRLQRDRLLRFAARFTPRCWAIEGATGTGALVAQQLVAAGETVLDVPPKLSARVRVLDTERSDKTDAHDARSAAIVALRHSRLRVVAVEDHPALLRLFAKRHHDLVAHRTRAICRLHTVLCQLVAGGLPKHLSATRAATELGRIRPADAIGVERRRRSSRAQDPNHRSGRRSSDHRHRRLWRWPGHGCLPHRLQRRCHPVPDRWSLRPLQRHRPHRSIIRANPQASTQPPREPPTQPRAPHRRGDPDPQRHPWPRLLPAQTDRGKHTKRSNACPQAAHQRRRLPPTPRRRNTLNERARKDNQGRLFNPAWPAEP